MTQLMTTEEMNAQTLWTPKQRNHLRRLMKQDATICYVCTDHHGRPSNGGPKLLQFQVRPGLVQVQPGPLKQYFGEGAFHGTHTPHNSSRWHTE
jgi:hypothetical protein